MSRRAFVLGSAAAIGGAGLYAIPRNPVSAGTIPTEDWAGRLVEAARSQIGVTLLYDPGYSRIAFPGGDVPRLRGVCTDVIIRAYRDALGIDLQRLVHDDMKAAFSAYPRLWGLTRPDANIDHRRVPNLRVFLERRKAGLPVSDIGLDYRPGDIVTQALPGNKTHIVLVADQLNAEGTRPLVIHNIGWGTRMEDILFGFPVTGHYRFAG